MSLKCRLSGLKRFLGGMIVGMLFVSPAMAHAPDYNNWGMGGMMGNWGMGWGWLGLIIMILFWGLIIVGLVLLIRWLVQATSTRVRPTAEEGPKALDILKERFARGEITRDEFTAMKKDLLE